MFDQPVRKIMQRRKLLKAAPDTDVARATQLMARRNVGALLVMDGEHLVGIFTERDVVFRVVAKGLDPSRTRIGDVMTTQVKTITPEKPLGFALMLMHDNGFRHLPVLQHGQPVGMISARAAMDPDLEEFVSEAQRRQFYRRTAEL